LKFRRYDFTYVPLTNQTEKRIWDHPNLGDDTVAKIYPRCCVQEQENYTVKVCFKRPFQNHLKILRKNYTTA